MFTADMARKGNDDDLDERIAYAVKNFRQGNGAYMRIYHDDSFRFNIVSELMKRGFKNIDAPSLVLKTDVYFEW
jgi:hypothetical protein